MRLSLFFCAAALFLACATPQPTPIPAPTPAPAPDAAPDPFSGALSDCHSLAVTSVRSLAVAATRACLAGPLFDSCLVGLFPSYTIDSVVCGVVENGEITNVARLKGTATPEDVQVSDAAGTWLTARKVGLR